GLADVLGQRVHDRLVQVLDDAVVGRVDVDRDLGHRPGLAAAEPGQRDGAQAVIAGPGQRPDDVGRAARGRDGGQHVARVGLRLELIGEGVLVADVVGDRRQQLHVRAEADHLRREVGAGPDRLEVIALEVVRDRGRAAVAAGEHRRPAGVRLYQDRRGAVYVG